MVLFVDVSSLAIEPYRRRRRVATVLNYKRVLSGLPFYAYYKILKLDLFILNYCAWVVGGCVVYTL